MSTSNKALDFSSSLTASASQQTQLLQTLIRERDATWFRVYGEHKPAISSKSRRELLDRSLEPEQTGLLSKVQERNNDEESGEGSGQSDEEGSGQSDEEDEEGSGQGDEEEKKNKRKLCKQDPFDDSETMALSPHLFQQLHLDPFHLQENKLLQRYLQELKKLPLEQEQQRKMLVRAKKEVLSSQEQTYLHYEKQMIRYDAQARERCNQEMQRLQQFIEYRANPVLKKLYSSYRTAKGKLLAARKQFVDLENKMLLRQALELKRAKGVVALLQDPAYYKRRLQLFLAHQKRLGGVMKLEEQQRVCLLEDYLEGGESSLSR